MSPRNNTALFILLSFFLAGCQPNLLDGLLDPDKKHNEGAGALSSAPSNDADAASTAAQPYTPAPEMPAWATDMIGKPLISLFPEIFTECIGSADLIAARFNSPAAFARIDGWAWSMAAGAPFDRLVGVNDEGFIIGAGASVYERPDVLAARGDLVTEAITGYQVQVTDVPGRVRIFGLADGLSAACYVSEITL